MPDFTQSSRRTPPKRRAGLDPASGAGYVVLAWIPGQAREDDGVWAYKSSEYRSRQLGLFCSISVIFHARFQFFSCFSRVIAEYMSSCIS